MIPIGHAPPTISQNPAGVKIAGLFYFQRPFPHRIIIPRKQEMHCLAVGAPLLRRQAARLASYKLRDVKILLASHAHADYVAGHVLLAELTGAHVFGRRGDDGVINSGGDGRTSTPIAAGVVCGQSSA